MDRRRLILSLTALSGCSTAPPAASPRQHAAQDDLAGLERELGGRLGVAALDVETGRRLAFRADERFPLCSTFKLLLAAAVLARVDAGREELGRRVVYDASHLLEYAPITREHAAEGSMSVEALCAAAVVMSDNTAANLLLETVDGPAGLTHYVRSLGDQLFRLDRSEPMLNTAIAGDSRDTTSPAAMLVCMRAILTGAALQPESRELLIGWLVSSPTGRARLRAALPQGWRAGDKTGTGNHGATNDVAIVWPPRRGPWLVAAYAHGSSAAQDTLNGALAKVGAIVVRALSAR
jgi:beta-lactamase class A